MKVTNRSFHLYPRCTVLLHTYTLLLCYVSIIREDIEQHDAFICTGWNCSTNTSSDDSSTEHTSSNNDILPIEHGGIRLIIPHLYGWKSAKYLTELHFLPYHAKVVKSVFLTYPITFSIQVQFFV
jgi:Oxidoreductase molybdopterin binding domain